MENYQVLFRLDINHEYFDGKEERFIEVKLSNDSLRMLRDRQLLFKQEKTNGWCLLGNVEGGGVYGDRDVLELEFFLKDPLFQYYTEWKDYRRDSVYFLDLSACSGKAEIPDVMQTIPTKEKKPGIFFSGKLRLSDRMFEQARKGEYDEVELSFASKKMFWEYWFIPRKLENKDVSLELEEQNKELVFPEPKLVNTGLENRQVFGCVSQTVIPMKKNYTYRMNLWEVVQKEPKMRRKVVKNIEYPVPGEFHDLVGNVLRRIVYF